MNFDLSPEQQFMIAAFNVQIEGASHEQAIQIAKDIHAAYQHQQALAQSLVRQLARADMSYRSSLPLP